MSELIIYKDLTSQSVLLSAKNKGIIKDNLSKIDINYKQYSILDFISLFPTPFPLYSSLTNKSLRINIELTNRDEKENKPL